MAPWVGGVWRWDGKSLTHHPVKEATEMSKWSAFSKTAAATSGSERTNRERLNSTGRHSNRSSRNNPAAGT